MLMLTGLSLQTLTDWHWPKLIHLRLLKPIGLRSLKQTHSNLLRLIGWH